MKIEKQLNKTIKALATVAGFMWQRGWAERNAGNISINLSHELMLKEEEDDIEEEEKYNSLEQTYKELADEILLLTPSGVRMRDLARNANKNILVVRLNKNGDKYKILYPSDNKKQQKPTSELPMHLAIHSMLVSNGRKDKVVVHAHVTELIAMSHDKTLFNSAKINAVLWSMHAETSIFVPEGVGIVPFCIPGSSQLATETLKALKLHKVAVLEKHGVVATGKDLYNVFDTMDVLSKSAQIYFMCKQKQIDVEYLNKKTIKELKLLGNTFFCFMLLGLCPMC